MWLKLVCLISVHNGFNTNKKSNLFSTFNPINEINDATYSNILLWCLTFLCCFIVVFFSLQHGHERLGRQKTCEIIRVFAEVFGFGQPRGKVSIATAPGSHSLTPGSWLCLRIALRQLPLRKSTRADTLNAGVSHGGRKRDNGTLGTRVINTAVLQKFQKNCQSTCEYK